MTSIHANLPTEAKVMMQRVEWLKRYSNNGQHMHIDGASAGNCFNLAIELEQFIGMYLKMHETLKGKPLHTTYPATRRDVTAKYGQTLSLSIANAENLASDTLLIRQTLLTR